MPRRTHTAHRDMEADLNPAKVVTVLNRWELPFRGPAFTWNRSRITQAGAAIVVLVGLGVLGLNLLFPTTKYREISPRRGDLTAHIHASGRIQPDNRVDIKAPIPGRIESILVREGDHVKKGQILLWMSSAERAAIIDAARLVGPEEVAHWEKRNPATPVIAPVDGLIIQRNVEAGQSFGTADAILVLSDRFVVEAPVDETDVARIREGQEAVTSLDAFPDIPLPSKVLRVAHESKAVNNVTSYMMEIELLKVPDFVRVGMTANVSFEMTSKRDALLIPSEALKATENEIYVLVGPAGGGRPEKRTIRIGLSDGNMTEVISGLSETETVYLPINEKIGKNPKSKPRAFMAM